MGSSPLKKTTTELGALEPAASTSTEKTTSRLSIAGPKDLTGFVGFSNPGSMNRTKAAGSWFKSFYEMFQSGIKEIIQFVPYGIYTPSSQLPAHELKGPRPKPAFLTRAFDALTTAISSLLAAPFAILALPAALTAGLIGKIDASHLLPNAETVKRYVGDYRLRKWMVRGSLILGGLVVLVLGVPAAIGGATAGIGFMPTLQLIGMTLAAGLPYILQSMGIGAFFGITSRLDGYWRRNKVPALEHKVVAEELTASDSDYLKSMGKQPHQIDQEFTKAFKSHINDLRARVADAQDEYKAIRKSKTTGWIFDWPIKSRMDARDKLDSLEAELASVTSYAALIQYEKEHKDGTEFCYRTPANIARDILFMEAAVSGDNAALKKIAKSKNQKRIQECKNRISENKEELKKLQRALDTAISYAVEHAEDSDALFNRFGIDDVQMGIINRVHASALTAQRNEVPVVEAVDPFAGDRAGHNRGMILKMQAEIQRLKLELLAHQQNADSVKADPNDMDLLHTKLASLTRTVEVLLDGLESDDDVLLEPISDVIEPGKGPVREQSTQTPVEQPVASLSSPEALPTQGMELELGVVGKAVPLHPATADEAQDLLETQAPHLEPLLPVDESMPRAPLARQPVERPSQLPGELSTVEPEVELPSVPAIESMNANEKSYNNIDEMPKGLLKSILERASRLGQHVGQQAVMSFNKDTNVMKVAMQLNAHGNIQVFKATPNTENQTFKATFNDASGRQHFSVKLSPNLGIFLQRVDRNVRVVSSSLESVGRRQVVSATHGLFPAAQEEARERGQLLRALEDLRAMTVLSAQAARRGLMDFSETDNVVPAFSPQQRAQELNEARQTLSKLTGMYPVVARALKEEGASARLEEKAVSRQAKKPAPTL